MAQSNKEIAVSFLQSVSGGRVREAYAKYAAPEFRHHNAYFEGSAAALAAAMEENAQANPDKALHIHNAIAEGELVALHTHVRQKPDDRGAALVHIFRFENGRIAELWDIAQPVPETSPNQYGMF
jgi:predicted SnoaL-like aldol condensation-catalyzing enzyme